MKPHLGHVLVVAGAAATPVIFAALAGQPETPAVLAQALCAGLLTFVAACFRSLLQGGPSS